MGVGSILAGRRRSRMAPERVFVCPLARRGWGEGGVKVVSVCSLDRPSAARAQHHQKGTSRAGGLG
jgi:hypothetical protein